MQMTFQKGTAKVVGIDETCGMVYALLYNESVSMKEQLQLCARNVTKKFKAITVLKNVSYTFKAGNTYAITGVSGSGKSTLMHILAGLDTATTGIVTFGDTPINAFSSQDRAKTIGLVFQYSYLIKELTVLENIELAGLCVGKSASEVKKQALELLHVVGLKHTSSWLVGQLSGGQKQRVALARALINRPSFLLADELTGNLDHDTGINIITLVLQYCRQWGMGLIVSSHNQEISHMMDLVFTLKDGRLFQQGLDKFIKQEELKVVSS